MAAIIKRPSEEERLRRKNENAELVWRNASRSAAVAAAGAALFHVGATRFLPFYRNFRGVGPKTFFLTSVVVAAAVVTAEHTQLHYLRQERVGEGV